MISSARARDPGRSFATTANRSLIGLGSKRRGAVRPGVLGEGSAVPGRAVSALVSGPGPAAASAPAWASVGRVRSRIFPLRLAGVTPSVLGAAGCPPTRTQASGHLR